MNAVGINIKRYRELLKINKKELAQELGCDPSLITRYEKGERIPPLDALLKLSRIFGITLEKLAVEPNDSVQMAARDCGKASAEERKEMLELETLAADYVNLLTDAGGDPAYKGPTYSSSTIMEKIPAIKKALDIPEVVEAEQLMASLRLHWNVQIFVIPFRKQNMSGLTLRIRDAVVIFLNRGHNVERRLFSLVHELCHVLCHLTDTSCVTSIVSSRDPQEKTANQFAEKFLIPDDRFLKELPKVNLHIGKQESVRELARRFNVSPECMFQDLCHRGYIQQNWASYKATLNYDKDYDQTWGIGDLPYLYIIAVYLNTKAGKISLAKAAQYLRTDIREMESYMTELDRLFLVNEKK